MQKSSAVAGYRLDIQGLRAIAALLVAVYHIWLGRVSGGVDVFFVVTGFLITSRLLRQAERDGSIDAARFWNGLARRLLPMAMLVLLAVALASVLWLPRPLWDETIQQVVASAFYLENWQLAFDAVDYLAQGQAASPVQHYWALSIQGQFYLIWPFAAAAGLGLGAWLRTRHKAGLLLVFAAIFVCSLAFSIYATRHYQTFTYFNTLARLWEFSIGALLAVIPRFELRRETRVAMGWLGLAGILACGLIFQVSRVFPGYAALWPTGCAVLIMLAGPSGSRFGADRFLSLKPLTYLGGISYGVYLWHWPLLVFYRWFTHHDTMQLGEGLAVLGGSIVLADLSTRLISKLPIASSEGISKPRLVSFVAAGVSPVLLVGLAWGGYYLEQRKDDARPISLTHPDYPGARARDPGFRYAGQANVPLYPGMLAVQHDVPQIYKDGCNRPDPEWQRLHCIYGERSASRTIALVGGSHSAHWLPALDILGQKHGWRVVVYLKSNCVFSEAEGRVALDKWCQDWNRRTMALFRQDPPEVIFTTSTRGSGAEEHVPEGFLQRWSQLQTLGIKVVAIRDTPWMGFWVPECLEMRGHNSMQCAQSREKVFAPTDPVKRLTDRPPNVHFIDLSQYFCDEQHCPPAIGNVIVYCDDSHITATYSRSLAPMLERQLLAALPPEWVARLAQSM
jgi:peptidoglycan/LPS O-acetylase OafA/YrhL